MKTTFVGLIGQFPATRKLLATAIFIIGLNGAHAASPPPIQPKSWYLTNNFACFSDGLNTTCGPHLAMDEGNGNGSFPSGFVQVSDGVSRIWIAPEISPFDVDYSTSVWTLSVGGTAAVTSFSWTVGLWDWTTSIFTAAEGPETIVTQTGRSTFAPTGPFLVPGRRLLAFRATGNSGNGAPSLLDVYDEAGGNSPTSLTVAGEPSDVAPPETIINDADKIACDSTGATLQSDCGWKWLSRYDDTISGADGAVDILVSPDGTRVFVTGVADRDPRQTDFVTIAYDAQTGSALWTAQLNGPVDSDDQPAAAAISPDGKHLYVTGRTCAAKGTLNCTGNMHYMTVSYDSATGTEEWRAQYGTSPNDYNLPAALAVSPDGTLVIVTGRSWRDTAYEYATVAYDAQTGAQRWAARYHGPGQGSDSAQAVVISPDTATAYVTGSSNGVGTGSDFLTIAYDAATGAVRWNTRFDGAAHGNDLPIALALHPSGDVLYVTGATTSDGSGRDYAVVAYSTANGDTLWTQLHNGQWNGDDWPSAIAVAPDGTRLFVTGREDEDTLASDAATVAYAADTGRELWISRYSGAGKHQDQPRDISVTPDGTAVAVTVMSLSKFPYSSADYVTIIYGANFGEVRASARYDGPGKDDDEPAALAISPDASAVFITGLSAGYGTSTTGSYDYATVAYSLPLPPTVVSRKAHGAVGNFDINLPLIGPAGVECRSGGPNSDYQVIFTFPRPLTSVASAAVSSGSGSIASSAIDSSDAHNYIVNLTGLDNAQTITLSLSGVNDGTNTGDIAVPMSILIGDISGNGIVSNADVASIKAQVAAPVAQSNFRNDITANGVISNTDVSATKGQVGTTLP
jgi:6-phosphogluconolactonase (cycloisomerase 2 family)